MRRWSWRHWTSANEGQWTLREKNQQGEPYHLASSLPGENSGNPCGAQQSPWLEEREMGCLGRSRQLEFAGQSLQEDRDVQSRELQRWKVCSAYMWENYLRLRKETLKGHRKGTIPRARLGPGIVPVPTSQSTQKGSASTVQQSKVVLPNTT